jgi:Zn-dependent protease with chaperone function
MNTVPVVTAQDKRNKPACYDGDCSLWTEFVLKAVCYIFGLCIYATLLIMGRKLNLILFFLFAVCIPFAASPQSPYTFQKDDTVLRKKYYDQSVKKKELLLASAGKENAKEYKKIYDAQFEAIDELWQSSRPVTSPEAHAYLQLVVQKIIDANSELKGTDARIVFSRDWWPNAVSMGDGTIAINAGLFIYMDNEAELVFVLCHELSHYYLEHTPKAIKKYVETVSSDAYQAELKRLSKTTYGVNKRVEELAKSTAFNSRRHSRDNEAAADRQAFMFMKKTGYDCGAIKTCLQLLDKVDDSLLHKHLDIQQTFNFTEYPFKKKWIQKESAIFSEVDDNSSLSKKERDSLKTHPDCAKRILLVNDSIQSMTSTGKKFLVSEKLFNHLKKDFFIEITEECYREKNLGRNLYYNLLLLQGQENTSIAVYSIARCLNELFDKQKNHQLGLSVDAESKGYPEEYNLLLRMIGRLRLEEIASLNYYFCNKWLQEMKDYPGFDQEISKAKKHKEE